MSKIDQPSGAEYALLPSSLLEESDYKFRICKKCRTGTRKDIVPTNSEFNEMGFDEVPAEISSLNNLELTLIALVRMFPPSVYYQTDAGAPVRIQHLARFRAERIHCTFATADHRTTSTFCSLCPVEKIWKSTSTTSRLAINLFGAVWSMWRK